jgi:hypothetical protein
MKKPSVKVKKIFFFDEHCRRGQFCPRIATWHHLNLPKLIIWKFYYFFMYIFCIVFVSFMYLFVSFCFFFKYEHVYHLSNDSNKHFSWINFIFLIRKVVVGRKITIFINILIKLIKVKYILAKILKNFIRL